MKTHVQTLVTVDTNTGAGQIYIAELEVEEEIQNDRAALGEFLFTAAQSAMREHLLTSVVARDNLEDQLAFGFDWLEDVPEEIRKKHGILDWKNYSGIAIDLSTKNEMLADEDTLKGVEQELAEEI